MQLSTGYHRKPRPERVHTADLNQLLLDAINALDSLKPEPVRAMALTNAREGRFDIADDATDHLALFDRGYDLIGHAAGLFEVHTVEGEIAPMRYEAIQFARQALRTQAIALLDANAKLEACRASYRQADEHDRQLLFMDGNAAAAHVQWNGWLFAGMVEAAVELFGADFLPAPTDRQHIARHRSYERGVAAVEEVVAGTRSLGPVRARQSRLSGECMAQADQRPRPPVDGYDEDDGEPESGAPFVTSSQGRTVLHSFAELKTLKDAGALVLNETGERPSMEELSAVMHAHDDAWEPDEIAALWAEETMGTGNGAAALGYTDDGRPDGWSAVRPAHASAIVEA